MIFFLFFILIFFKFSLSFITSYGLQTNFQNVNWLQSLNLTFAIENLVPSGSYIKLITPKTFGSITGSLLDGTLNIPVTVSWDTSTSSPLQYFFLPQSTLQNDKLYQLQINVGTSPNTVGILGLIKIQIVGDTTSNALIYDKNDAFEVLAMAPQPGNAIQGNYSVPQAFITNVSLPGLQYEIRLDITPAISIEGFPDFNVSGVSSIKGNLMKQSTDPLSQCLYTVQSCQYGSYTCGLTDGPTCQNISLPVNGTCLISSDRKSFTLSSGSPIIKFNIIRAILIVQNPIIPQSCDLQIMHLSSNPSSFLYEYTMLTGFLNLNLLQVLFSKVNFLWGVGVSASNKCPIGLYYSWNNAASARPVANNFFVQFSVDRGITNAGELAVRLTIGPQSKIVGVLEGSILTFNFIALPNSDIVCRSNNPLLQDVAIVCRGISSLQAGVIYQIGARVYVIASDSQLGSISNYPKVKIFSIMNGNSIDVSSDQAYSGGIQFYQSSSLLNTLNKGVNRVGYVLSNSWVLAYQQSDPTQFFNLTNFLTFACLSSDGTLPLFTASCQNSYKYGFFREWLPSSTPNRIVLLLNGFEVSNSICDSTASTGANVCFGKITIIKILWHSGYFSSSSQFGAQIIGNLLGSVASSTACSTSSSSGKCMNDQTSITGIFATDNTLINRFDISSQESLAVITITCKFGSTFPDPSLCAFKASSRSNDNDVSIPGLEIKPLGNSLYSNTFSSPYAEDKTRDLIICIYNMLASSVTTSTAILNVVASNAGLKVQGLFNFYHIDIPTSNTDFNTSLRYVNAYCSTNDPAFNDGNKIPIYLRITYTIASNQAIGTFGGLALFFKASSNIARYQFTDYNFASNDLLPHQISTTTFQVPTDSIPVEYYPLYRNPTNPPLEFGDFHWNYHPYYVIRSNLRSNDILVPLASLGNPNCASGPATDFDLGTVVVATLTVDTFLHFFQINGAWFFIGKRMSYKDTGFYSPKFSNYYVDNVIAQTSSFSSANFDSVSFNCRPGTIGNSYPMTTTNFVIGAATTLSVSTQSNLISGCQGSGLGYAFTMSSFSYNFFSGQISVPTGWTLPCQKINVKLKATVGSSNAILYTYVCPIPQGDINAGRIDLQNFVPPFWFGKAINASPTTVLKDILNFGWSIDSNLKYATGQIYQQNFPTSVGTCISTAYTSIYRFSLNQRIFFTLKTGNIPLTFPLNTYNAATLTVTPYSSQQIVIVDTLSTVQTSVSFLTCQTSISGLSCSITVSQNVISYVLTSSTVISIPAGVDILVSAFVSQTSDTVITGVKHTTTVQYLRGDSTSAVQFLSCGAVGTDFLTGSPRSKTIAISNQVLFRGIEIMSDIGFTMTFPTGFEMYKIGQTNVDTILMLSLGTFWHTNNVINQANCLVSDAITGIPVNALPDMNFNTNIFSFIPSSGVSTFQTISFRCNGVYSPKSSTIPTNIIVYASSSTSSVLYNGQFAINLTGVPTPLTILSLNSTTRYFTVGMEAVFVINATFNSNVSLSSRINVWLNNDFEPYFSQRGPSMCFVNSIYVLCEKISASALSMKSSKYIPAGSQVIIEVHGIKLSDKTGIIMKANIQVDNDNDPSNGIVEHRDTVLGTPSPFGSTIVPFSIYQYSLTNSYIRNKASHLFVVRLPSGTVIQNANLYFFFPIEYEISFLNKIDPISVCQLVNKYNFSNLNFAQTCVISDQRVVKMTLSADPQNSNSPVTYHIMIGELQNPSYLGALPEFPKIATLDPTYLNATSLSIRGYSNSSSIVLTEDPTLKFVRFTDTNGNPIDSVKVYRNYFATTIQLSYPANSYSTGLEIVPANASVDYIFLWQILTLGQNILKVPSGMNSISFQIGATEDFAAGLYFMNWVTNISDPNIGSIPTLAITLDEENCVIQPSSLTVNVPVGGDSLPIIFDFSSCMPLEDVKLISSFSSSVNANPQNSFFMENSTIQLKNTYDGQATQIGFVAKSQTGVSPNVAGVVTFGFAGTNANGFLLSTNSINLVTVSSSAYSIVLTPTATKVSPIAGGVILEFQCGNSATIYYVLGIGIGNITGAYIKSVTLDQGIFQTSLVGSDKAWTIYGYLIQTNQASVTTRIDGKVRAETNYTITYYCRNQMGVYSAPVSSQWIQSSNQATIGEIHYSFNRPLGAADLLLVLDHTCLYMGINFDRVYDFLGTPCQSTVSRRRMLLASNSKTSVMEYRIYVLPDLKKVADDTQAKTQLVKGVSLRSLGVTLSNADALMVSVNTVNIPIPTVKPSVALQGPISSFDTYMFVIYQVPSLSYFYGGVAFRNVSKPDASNLILGKDNNGGDYVAFNGSLYSDSDVNITVNFTNLNPVEQYVFYFTVGNINVGDNNRLFSDVQTVNFTTRVKARFSTLLNSFCVILLSFLVFFGQ